MQERLGSPYRKFEFTTLEPTNHSIPSLQTLRSLIPPPYGFNYSMNFVDEYSRYSHIYFMNTRTNESKRVLEEFLSDIRRLGWRVTRLRSDLGSEYVNNNSQSDTKATFESTLSEFEKICDQKILNLHKRRKGFQSLMVSLNGTTAR